MDNQKLNVFREINGSYQLVGELITSFDSASFSYDRQYLKLPDSCAISQSLPLTNNSFGIEKTKAFFSGLLPEGANRRALMEAFRVGENDFGKLLLHLNNESIGALVFCEDDCDPLETRGYEQLSAGILNDFAMWPREKALELNTASRLSLAGEQTKIGLFHQGDDYSDKWFLPVGSAPSTHIVKASNALYRGETVNEALCLNVAKRMGFDAAECHLMRIKNAEPLLVVRRFDRYEGSESNFPRRVHQEDFCQALGLSPDFKYEPTDGHYAALGANLISKVSSNPFGDRAMFFSRLLFDWAIGNCDNHLKNHSLTLDKNWQKWELSPLYDVICTTVYPGLSREMGVSLCESRHIDDVTVEDMVNTAKRVGVPEKMAMSEIGELGELFVNAVEAAADDILHEGFTEVTNMATYIKDDFSKRYEKLSL